MIQAFTISEAGGHPVNEDAFLVQQHPDDVNCWICTLADGQGGRAGGGRASQLACQTVMALAAKLAPSRLMDPSAWGAIFREADVAVSADADAGFTTLIGFCLLNDTIVGGSNGDSAVAVFDSTKDCDELTRNQRKNPPIGSDMAAFVPFTANLKAPYMVLAMSDGVWKYSRWDGIKEAAKRLRCHELAEELARLARLPVTGQLQDDFTLVVMQEDGIAT